MKSAREAKSTDFERKWQYQLQRYAGLYEDDACIAGWTQTGLDARVKRFECVWRGDAAGKLWLDAGSGAGTYARLLAARDLSVVGLDYSVGTVRKARQRGSERIHWAVGDVKRLPLRSASVDGVLCFGVTQAQASTGPTIQELSRVTKQNGQVWIDALNGWCLPHLAEQVARRLSRRPPHLRYESPKSLRRAMQSAGIERLRLFWLPIVPRRVHFLQGLFEHPLIVALFRFFPPIGALLSHSFILYGERVISDGKRD